MKQRQFQDFLEETLWLFFFVAFPLCLGTLLSRWDPVSIDLGGGRFPFDPLFVSNLSIRGDLILRVTYGMENADQIDRQM